MSTLPNKTNVEGADELIKIAMQLDCGGVPEGFTQRDVAGAHLSLLFAGIHLGSRALSQEIPPKVTSRCPYCGVFPLILGTPKGLSTASPSYLVCSSCGGKIDASTVAVKSQDAKGLVDVIEEAAAPEQSVWLIGLEAAGQPNKWWSGHGWGSQASAIRLTRKRDAEGVAFFITPLYRGCSLIPESSIISVHECRGECV